MRCLTLSVAVLWLSALFGPFVPAGDAAEPDGSGAKSANRSRVVAADVDRLLEASFAKQQVTPAAICDDETFLRRVTLDIVGTVPTPNEITLFGLDSDPLKRAKLVDQLLASPKYGENWGSLFREVIFSRATEERARIGQQKFEDWLAESLNKGRPWNELVTEILTATGNSAEDGRTAFMMAHTGNAEELAGETARIFLGIQLQCANCHDHPTDAWKREQFHELAAYFPRVQVRADLQARPPTFTVASVDISERQEQLRDRTTPEQLFRLLDFDRDGFLTDVDAKKTPRQADRLERLFDRGDNDNDGKISLDEFKAASAQFAAMGNRRSSEHYMADLEHPDQKGTKMQPVFFLSGDKVPFGTSDLDRRGELAAQITSASNPWFSKSFVNRVWGEMLGESFYPIVDDMGPERTAEYPEVLDTLSQAFVQSGYDAKWLIRTIANTQAYQRALGTRQPGDSPPRFAAAVTTRLRSDQIYNATRQALGVTGFVGTVGRNSGGADPMSRYLQRLDPGRVAFFRMFNYDPSTPQDELLGSIPQALFLMNSPLLQSLAGASSSRTMLGGLLADNPDDQDALSELYLRTLSRNPSKAEQKLCEEYIRTGKSRAEAYEDIFWSLLNSSEFVTKH
ncbi:MAG: DUF1549 domain-containing protein [Planctomycetaceae bacterium]